MFNYLQVKSVSWSRAELPSLDCGGTGIMAHIFGTSSELPHVDSAYSFCLIVCFVCFLLSPPRKETQVHVGILNMSK